MQTREQIVDTLRCLYFTTNLPIWFFNESKLEISFPENINCAEKIIKNQFSIPSFNINDDNIQIVKTEYLEKFLIYNLKDFNRTIIIGPILTRRVETGALTNMVNKKVVPFHSKTLLQEYYSNSIIVDDTKLHYITILLKRLINGDYQETISSNEDINNEELKLDEEYINQKHENRYNDFLHSPYIIEQEISKTISNGDTENAKKILKEINLNPHARLATTSLRSYKNSMICSCTYMTRAAIAGGVNPDYAFTLSDTYINKIEELNSLDELENIESVMIEGFTNLVKEVKTTAYSPSIVSTINYIDNHLCEDIDTKLLADHVYLNPSYLSSLFHKETGITLSDWIKKRRIEEAAHFVANSNQDFSEIAFMYKFCSQSYFVQCFKKIMKITPGEYRKNKKTY